MKKRKGLYLALLMMLFTMVFGMSSMAATKTVAMKPNRLYHVKRTGYDDVTYHRFTVSKTGYITVYGYSCSDYSSSKYSIGVQLYNSKKKPLETNRTYISSYSKPAYKTYYAVKKGTYYIAVRDRNYKLKYSFTALTDKSGATQAKATAVGKGKRAVGLLVAGESGKKVDWFKIRLTKNQKINFTFSSKSNDDVRFQVVPADSRVMVWGSSVYVKNTTKKIPTQNAFPAGTYYIKVSRMLDDASTSGYYSFSWK